MRIYNKSGSKERLLEMMKGVNKIKLNEETFGDSLSNTLEEALQKLKSGALNMEQGGSYRSGMQTVNDTIYVGINGYDRNKNMYNFNFKITGTEDDIDGVTNVQDVILEKFYYQNPQGQKVFDVNEDDLVNFNAKHGSELYDVIEKYIDVDIKPGEEFDKMGEDVEKKENSYPYNQPRDKFQDDMGYGDEKPVNSKLRVKSPSLDKFVKEEDNNPMDEINFKKWNSRIPYNILNKLEMFGSSSFRPQDARTATTYHKLPDDYIVASDSNYAITRFKPYFGGIIKKNDRLYDRDGNDVTDKIKNEAKEYSYLSDSMKNYIGLDDDLNENNPCWKGHEMIGMKEKNGKEVPNCVPNNMNEQKYLDYKSKDFDNLNDNEKEEFYNLWIKYEKQ